MISALDLTNRAVEPEILTDRQLEVFRLVRDYYAVTLEFPSSGYIARKLSISRATAHEHMQIVREKLGIARRY